MLIELIKNKSNVSFDYYKEIILSYRNIANEPQNWKIEQYLENYSLEERILNIIKYSLDENSIKTFIDKLSNNKDGVTIHIIGKITELKHQDYNGKRVVISLKDKFGYEINAKLDIGVHKDFEIEQDVYCFNLDVFNESVNLLINSVEQIFVEKMKSLLKLGYVSSRYKDILDFYYLINNCSMDKDKLSIYFKKYIMLENTPEDIYIMLQKIFARQDFKITFIQLEIIG